MAGAAWIPQVTLKPSEGMFHQGGGLLPLRGCAGCCRCIAAVQEQHQGSCELLSGPTLRLALPGMPIPIPDSELLMQPSR